jgi:hypothetical protein
MSWGHVPIPELKMQQKISGWGKENITINFESLPCDMFQHNFEEFDVHRS